MSWPYVEPDDNDPAASKGWYADAEGVISQVFPTEVEAYQWALDRVAMKLGQARHGCAWSGVGGNPCRLHEPPQRITPTADVKP